MTRDYLAVLDACTLVGGGLRDTLLRLAEDPRLYIPKWSDDIIGEVNHTLEYKYSKSVEQISHLGEQLRKAFPEAWVCGYQPLEAGLEISPKDRHVLAAAIRCGAQTIVTFNLRYFTDEIVRPYDIEAIHPDEFLVNRFIWTPPLTDQEVHRAGRPYRPDSGGPDSAFSPDKNAAAFYSNAG